MTKSLIAKVLDDDVPPLDWNPSWKEARAFIYELRLTIAVMEPDGEELLESWFSPKARRCRQVLRGGGDRPLARFLLAKDRIIGRESPTHNTRIEVDLPGNPDSEMWPWVDEIEAIYMRLLSGDDSGGDEAVARAGEIFRLAADAEKNKTSRDGDSLRARRWRFKDEIMGGVAMDRISEKNMTQNSAFMAAFTAIRPILSRPCKSEADLETARQAMLACRAEFDRLNR